MKISVNKLNSMIILLFLTGCIIKAQEQQPLGQQYLAEQLVYAKSLFEKQEYFDAVTELKRLAFFDKKALYSFEVNYLIGESYKAGAWFSDAIKYYTLAQRYAPDDSVLFDLKTEIIRCNILRRTIQQAHALLNQLESSKSFSHWKSEISYWRGWSYIFEDKWEKAAEEFGKISADHPLKKLALEVQNDKYSVSFAKVISYILPGFGQFYTGNYLSGIMSICWTGLMGYLALEAFNADRIFDGFIMTGLFFRFYRGNTQNAENFAVQRNKEISDNALNYLQYKFQGLKP
ncbi:MAG: hypothetical protein ACM34K_11390 [Bacillota bacterium]